jgi:hypothetical protein
MGAFRQPVHNALCKAMCKATRTFHSPLPLIICIIGITIAQACSSLSQHKSKISDGGRGRNERNQPFGSTIRASTLEPREALGRGRTEAIPLCAVRGQGERERACMSKQVAHSPSTSVGWHSFVIVDRQTSEVCVCVCVVCVSCVSCVRVRVRARVSVYVCSCASMRACICVHAGVHVRAESSGEPAVHDGLPTLLIDTTAPGPHVCTHTHLSVTSGESSFAALSSRRFPTKHQGHMTSETIRTLTTRAIVGGFSFCRVGLVVVDRVEVEKVT